MKVWDHKNKVERKRRKKKKKKRTETGEGVEGGLFWREDRAATIDADDCGSNSESFSNFMI